MGGGGGGGGGLNGEREREGEGRQGERELIITDHKSLSGGKSLDRADKVRGLPLTPQPLQADRIRSGPGGNRDQTRLPPRAAAAAAA